MKRFYLFSVYSEDHLTVFTLMRIVFKSFPGRLTCNRNKKQCGYCLKRFFFFFFLNPCHQGEGHYSLFVCFSSRHAMCDEQTLDLFDLSLSHSLCVLSF